MTAEDITGGRLGYSVFEPTAHCGLEDPAMWIIRLILLTNITLLVRSKRMSSGLGGDHRVVDYV